MVKYIPDRGDIVWIDFNPQSGRKIMKTRPALVVSPKKYNELAGLALFMPITSQIKGYPFEEPIEMDVIKGALLCDQLRSLDWQTRKARLAGQLPSEIINRALEKLKLLLLCD
jgi:mRNA interferase MazF